MVASDQGHVPADDITRLSQAGPAVGAVGRRAITHGCFKMVWLAGERGSAPKRDDGEEQQPTTVANVMMDGALSLASLLVLLTLVRRIGLRVRL